MRWDYFNATPNARSLWYSSAFLLFTIVVEFIIILHLNGGHFAFTLDDPYIHLALARNILRGHYGINLVGYSAPSSSILWPFILAPFSMLRHAEYIPLLINLAGALGTLVVFWKILNTSICIDAPDGKKTTLFTILLVLFILATNIIGLVLSGMEHSLQVLFSVLILRGLIYELENKKIPLWLAASIVIAPLIRYECLALSVTAIVFLFCRRYYRVPLISSILLILCLGGFSLFLVHLGLGPFPTSIMAKSSVVSSGAYAYSLVIHLKDNLFHNLHNPKGVILSLGMLFLLYQALFSRIGSGKRLLAGVIALAAGMHLLVGRFGMLNRYEIYIWVFCLLALIYVNGEQLSAYFSGTKFKPTLALMGMVMLVAGRPYIYGLIILPLASNNIYEQQYQMHRFAVEYYHEPVAANDIGYVSYENSHYVLDLAGLGSQEALYCRRHACNRDWMDALARTHDVRFAKIYSDWFRSIPAGWVKVGVLQLGKTRVSPAESKVTFYAMDAEALNRAVRVIGAFRASLPEDVSFTVNSGIAGAISKQKASAEWLTNRAGRLIGY